jgi:hypothetical protein
MENRSKPGDYCSMFEPFQKVDDSVKFSIRQGEDKSEQVA